MSLVDAFRVAFEALVANKMHALLTMLGIVIGVGAVIALMAVGKGSQKAVTDRIEGLGSNLVFVRPGSSTQAGVSGGAGSPQTLSMEDSEAILAFVPEAVVVAPEVRIPLQVSGGGQNTFTRAAGITADYAGAYELTVAEGFFISLSDVDQRSRVAVLGSGVAQQLFPDTSPLDEQIRLGLGEAGHHGSGDRGPRIQGWHLRKQPRRPDLSADFHGPKPNPVNSRSRKLFDCQPDHGSSR